MINIEDIKIDKIFYYGASPPGFIYIKNINHNMVEGLWYNKKYTIYSTGYEDIHYISKFSNYIDKDKYQKILNNIKLAQVF